VIKFTAMTTENGLAKAFGSQGAILTATFMVNAGAPAGTSLLNLTDSATGLQTALFDGSVLRNNLSINPAITDGVDEGVDAVFSVLGAAPSDFDASAVGNVTPLDALAAWHAVSREPAVSKRSLLAIGLAARDDEEPWLAFWLSDD
jgi:hypothetical protein